MEMVTTVRTVILGLAGLYAVSVHAAEHKHTPRGVQSLDVYGEGTRVHLLTGETRDGSDKPLLFHARSEDGGATWSPTVRVDAGIAPGFSLHRGMDAQIVAAGDHVVAVWMTAGTDKWGSGPMATALSTDGGRTWRAGPNPADDGSTTGHGFIDVTADNTGRFHLTWLDSRDGKQGLRYARSFDHGSTWSPNTTPKAATCECCSNAIIAGPGGDMAILFRDGKPRDMQIVRSRDGGERWLAPITMGRFDWHFDGCPHVGGGLALTGRDESAVFHALTWTGVAERTGVYYVAIPARDQVASEPRQLGDATSSHPDLVANAQGHLAAVWNSATGGTPGIWAATSTDAGRNWSEPRRLSGTDGMPTHPRVAAAGNGFRAFWTVDRADKPTDLATAVLP